MIISAPTSPRWMTVPLGRLFRRIQRLPRPVDGVVTAFRDGQVALRSRRRTDGFTEAIQEIGYQGIRKGDLVIHAMDAFAGAIGVSEDDGKSSPVYTVLTPSSTVEPRFYAYVLRNFAKGGGIQALTQGIRERSTDFRWAVAKTVPVPFPRLEEQTAIADYLDRETAEIDAFVMELDRFMSLTEERRNAARSKFFSPSHAENLLPIKRVARLAGGAGFPPAYQGITDEELPFYKVGSLNSAEEGKLTYASDSISRSTARSLGAEVLPAGSVVMAKIGAALFLRRNALLTKPGCIDNNMLGLIPASLVDGRYLQEVLLTLDLTPIANPGAVPSLNMRWFRETKIEVPSLEVQNEVLARFSELDSAARLALADAAKAKELAQERRSALISAGVTGQIDVTAQSVSAAEQLRDELEGHV